MKKVTIIIAIMFLAGLLTAQLGPPPGMKDGMRTDKEGLRERIEMIRMWKLIEILNLTQEQSVAFLPIFNAYESSMDVEMKEVDELLDKLESELEADKPNESSIEETLDRLKSIRINRCEAEEEFQAQIEEILTIEQRAEYALFKRKFGEEVRKILDMGRGHGMPKP